MTIRAQQIIREFPEVPKGNIMLGTRKDLMRVDVLLDDAVHNLERSLAAPPVLFDQPWHQRETQYKTKPARVVIFVQDLSHAMSLFSGFGDVRHKDGRIRSFPFYCDIPTVACSQESERFSTEKNAQAQFCSS